MAKTDTSLTFQETRDLVAMGLSISQVRELADAGFTAEQITELADAQRQAKAEIDARAADAMRAGMSQAIEANKPRRTSREDADYERISAYNPRGDRDYPRPGLVREVWWGVLDQKDPLNKPPVAIYPIEADSCTAEEQAALNALQPIRTTLQRNDDQEMPVHVVPTYDTFGRDITKLVIAVPKQMYEKDHRNQMPPLRKLAAQLAQAAVAA